TGGYLAMRGHGYFGVVVAALTTGLAPLETPTTQVLMDTSAGLVCARAQVEDGHIGEVAQWRTCLLSSTAAAWR
ncbi:MAG: proline racemase family protein, partial [Anaerolineae bacterium]